MLQYFVTVDKDNKISETTVPPPIQKTPDLQLPPKNTDTERTRTYDKDEVFINMNPKSEDRPTSFFAQPGILAGNLCHCVL